MSEGLISVAVPAPLYSLFDYRVALDSPVQPGCRVLVPFGRRQLVGIATSAPRPMLDTAYDYKAIDRLIDRSPLLPPELISLAAWIADYYQHPVGEVYASLLPGPLRRGETPPLRRETRYALTAEGAAALPQLPARARLQHIVLELLQNHGALTREALRARLPQAAAGLRRLLQLGWVQALETAMAAAPAPAAGPALTADQAAADAALQAAGAGFGVHLLQGVTGSGKTEVYLQAIARARAQNRQALVLVPEIGLTPQLLERVRARFGEAAAGYHSGLSEAERAQVWLRMRADELDIVVGTRSAVFLPMPRLGLIVVDEEHDASLKQQDGLRYSARDLAVLRGSRENAPVILGSATPSLESLQRAQAGRYRLLRLPRRVQDRAPPRLQLLDVRGLPLQHGLSQPLIAGVRRHLDEGGQVLLFINRRGYAPALLCHDCGWVAGCRQCDARLTWHRSRGRLLCHHCGAAQAVPARCPQCDSAALRPAGQGTERIEEALRGLFPEARCERFDSDRLRSMKALDALLRDTREGRVNLLVGTQMLAKGHDFAGLSLVAIVDADAALYSVDFRALERMGQLLTQVAGRAGRAEHRGEVLVQTHQPQHPALRCLVEQGYDALAALLLEERRSTGLPPYGHLALLRAEGASEAEPMRFLEAAAALLSGAGGDAEVQVLGPVPAPMERRAGRYRAQLLLQARSRGALQKRLKTVVPQLDGLPQVRRLRWSLDVDPVDLY